MIKEALEYVAKILAPAAVFTIPEEAVEHTFFDKPVHRPDPPRAQPVANARQVATLRSLVAYLETNVDDLELHDHLVHVVSPTRVDLVSSLFGAHRQRETALVAIYDSGVDAVLDRFVDVESMIIGLMSMFSPQGDRDVVLDLLKSLSKEDLEVREDSGLSQGVTVKAGIVTKSRASTPNPVTLYPYSMFTEASLVPRLFVLRLRSEPSIQVLLKSADGNAWEVAAVENIAVEIQRMRGAEVSVPAIIY